MMTTTSQTLDIVRRLVGRRSKITRAEMADILRALGAAGLDLQNGYVPDTIGAGPVGITRAADTWASRCRDLTCISVDARGSLRDGCVRYDQPGSMHPLQRAELVFVAEALGRYEYDQIGQMRGHADRLLIVRDEPDAPMPAPQPAPVVYMCDQGHRWTTGEDRCPTCGEYWV